MTTAQYNAELEAELAELRLTQAIRADRLKLAHQIAELRERQAQEASQRMTAAEHNRFPNGRWT